MRLRVRCTCARESGGELGRRRAAGPVRAGGFAGGAVARSAPAGIRAVRQRAGVVVAVLRVAGAGRGAFRNCDRHGGDAAAVPCDVGGGRDEQGAAMNTPARILLLAIALVVLAPAAASLILAMPAFGHPLSQYGMAEIGRAHV